MHRNPDDELRSIERAAESGDDAKLYQFNQQQRRLGQLKTKAWNIFSLGHYPAYLGTIVLPDPVTRFDVIERIRAEKGWRTHDSDAEIIIFGQGLDQRVIVKAYMVCNYLEPNTTSMDAGPRPAESISKLFTWIVRNCPCDPEKHWDSRWNHECLACFAVEELRRGAEKGAF